MPDPSPTPSRDVGASTMVLATLIAETAGAAPRQAGRLLLRVPSRRRDDVIRQLERKHLAALQRVLRAMPADDAARLLRDLPHRPLVADKLHPETLRQVESLLDYPEGTAGHIMSPGAVTVDPAWTADQTLAHLREVGKDVDSLDILYVVSAEGGLIDDLRLRTLALAAPATLIGALLDGQCPRMRDDAPVMDAVHALEQHDRASLPVVDAGGRLLGVITFDDAMRVARERHTDVVQMLGGTEALDEPYLTIPLLKLVRKRGSWLVVLFLGEMLTATAMQHYNAEVNKATVLALFLPLIISSGGNSGSQGSTLLIRAMALGEVVPSGWFRVLRREVATGLLLGVLLGVVGLMRIHLWQWGGLFDYGAHYHLIALTVGTALVGVVTWGAVMGAMLPLGLRALKMDPAAISAPLVATLVDVTGLIIYFSTAMVILRGTLL